MSDALLFEADKLADSGSLAAETQQALRAAAVALADGIVRRQGGPFPRPAQMRQRLMRALAEQLQQVWELAEQQEAARLQTARAAAARSCAYVRCANLGGGGGPAAGEGSGSSRCSACRVAW